MTGFDGECKFRCLMLYARRAHPNGADELTTLCVSCQKTGVSRASPVLDVASILGSPDHLARRSGLASHRLQAVVQHLPQNWFVCRCEPRNHIIHRLDSVVLLEQVTLH